MTQKATRLYPLPPRDIPADAIYEDLELPPAGWRHPSRPYVIINMVSSVDGQYALEGLASPLGSRTDRQTMRNLRSKADAVMVGAGTLRAEKLSLGLDEPGRTTQPHAVILTNSGDLPLETNLIIGEGQELLVISPPGVDVQLPEGPGRRLSVPATRSGDVDVGKTLEMLKREYAIDLLLVEGGPTLNHSLISANLVDEFFLTLAPMLVGNTRQPTHLTDSTPASRDLKLLSAYLAQNELFLRYGPT